MTSQKCQPKLGQKVHGLITMDMFEMTKRFFYACLKWVFFYQIL